jgi:hypothetical protein
MLDRYYEAFENGGLSAAECRERVERHRGRLEMLREQDADLTRRLATQADEPPDTAALANLADQLDVIGNESPEQAKELLRLLMKEIRVHDRRRILPIYHVPAAVRAIPRKVGRTEHCANQDLDEVLAPSLAI